MDVDVDLTGWVCVGLGGTYGCRCGTTPAAIGWWDVSGFVDSSLWMWMWVLLVG